MTPEQGQNAAPGPPRRSRSATALSARSLEVPRKPELHVRAEQWQERLAIPVLIAALVSVPAVFLMSAGGLLRSFGIVLNWASVAVLLSESVALILLSQDISDWVRAHKWELLLAAVLVPIVVFAVLPAQVLRVVMAVGTLRVLRIRKIINAARTVARRMDLGRKRKALLIACASVLAAGFLAILLSKPHSKTRQVFEWSVNLIGLFPAILAWLGIAAVLTASAYALSRWHPFRKIQALLRGKPPEKTTPNVHDPYSPHTVDREPYG